VDWLFGIGLSFEIAGALLLVFPILVKPRWQRGLLFPASGPTKEALEELSYSEAGLLVLIAGFVLQLVGYVLQAPSWWVFLLVCLATTWGMFVLGGLFAGRVLLKIDMALAWRQYRTTESYRQEQEARSRVGQPPLE
jgi:hypothetical protein